MWGRDMYVRTDFWVPRHYYHTFESSRGKGLSTMPNDWQAEAARAAHAEDRTVFPMKLVYFNLRGVVEVARYMLHMGGAEYEDFRYPFDLSNWAKPASAAPHRLLRASVEGQGDASGGSGATPGWQAFSVRTESVRRSLIYLK